MESLNGVEKRIIVFIVRYLKQYQFPPSMREIADEMGWTSTSTAYRWMHSLEGKGWIEWPHGRLGMPRAYRVPEIEILIRVLDIDLYGVLNY